MPDVGCLLTYILQDQCFCFPEITYQFFIKMRMGGRSCDLTSMGNPFMMPVTG